MVDASLEALIDRAGREKVFSLLRLNGWNLLGGVPKHVFYSAALMLLKETETDG